MTRQQTINAWSAYAAVAFFWGTTFYAIRVGVQSFPPFLMAAFRHCIGGVLICSYFLIRGYSIPSKKDLKIFAINGFLMLVIGNGFVTWAEQYVSSGLAALICSLTPVWIIGINALKNKTEKLTWPVYAGVILCLIGQVLIFKDSLQEFTNPNYTIGIVLIFIANAAWAIGTVYSKNNPTVVHPLFVAGLQMIAGGIILQVIGTLNGEWSRLNPTKESVAALVYLIFFGSILAYGAYMYVIKNLPAATVSTYAYVNTLVAVLLGWLFLAEKLNALIGIAVMLTLTGVYLVNNKSLNSKKRT